MKKKLVESVAPIKTRKKGWQVTVQEIKEIMVFNIYENKILKARHCINIITHDFATLRGNTWENTDIRTAMEVPGWQYGAEGRFNIRAEDVKRIKEVFPEKRIWNDNAFRRIVEAEWDVRSERRYKAEQSRGKRIKELMSKVPAVQVGIETWIDNILTDGEDWCLKNEDTGYFKCSACGSETEKEKLRTEKGDKPKDRDMITCPNCRKSIRYLSRKRKVQVKGHFCVMQKIDKEYSVARHFVADIGFDGTGARKYISIGEEIRLMLPKTKSPVRARKDIYYEQFSGYERTGSGDIDNGTFDNKGNPANKRLHKEYLYEGAEEALRGTAYEKWGRLFEQMAGERIKLDYNAMMCGYKDDRFYGMIEMLYRGRFWKLLSEESEKVGFYNGGYYSGNLNIDGRCAEEVLDIADKQKINRLREHNGGGIMLEWLAWSDRHSIKISEKALIWLEKNNINRRELQWGVLRMSPEKIMNYIERQKKEQYKGMTIKEVINQYEDYMTMCNKLGKDTTDEMVHRPRELKRRHDEAVKELESRAAEIQAEEYSEKFGEAEKVLQIIQKKFNYTGEEFFIKVPEKIVDIVKEGNYLHHCAGATDRYFDRIKQNETYICFLRKVEEPDTPFYTIEVEPGGTIRQHRGMYDEEPEIDAVKPFLKEWQREIRKRMSKMDHELAAVSAEKREANLAELREKNNTRVLNGLMEDFMEAI